MTLWRRFPGGAFGDVLELVGFDNLASDDTIEKFCKNVRPWCIVVDSATVAQFQRNRGDF